MSSPTSVFPTENHRFVLRINDTITINNNKDYSCVTLCVPGI